MRFYHSMDWRRMSAAIMVRDHYECQECRKRLKAAAAEGRLLPATERRIRRATQVHHMIPYEVRPDMGLDPDNLEAICDRCHNIAHDRTGGCMKPKKKRATEEKW